MKNQTKTLKILHNLITYIIIIHHLYIYIYNIYIFLYIYIIYIYIYILNSYIYMLVIARMSLLICYKSITGLIVCHKAGGPWYGVITLRTTVPSLGPMGSPEIGLKVYMMVSPVNYTVTVMH